MTTQNLKVALHVPIAAPVVGDAIKVTAVSATNPPTTEYAPAGGGGGGGVALPTASRQGQLLVAGAGPGFAPTWGDGDCGRF